MITVIAAMLLQAGGALPPRPDLPLTPVSADVFRRNSTYNGGCAEGAGETGFWKVTFLPGENLPNLTLEQWNPTQKVIYSNGKVTAAAMERKDGVTKWHVTVSASAQSQKIEMNLVITWSATTQLPGTMDLKIAAATPRHFTCLPQPKAP